MAFGLVIYFVISDKESWLGTINRLDPFSSNNKNKEVGSNARVQVSSSQEADKTGNKNIKNDAGIDGRFLESSKELLRFAPDNEVDLLSDEEPVSPYDKEVKENTSDNNQAMSSVNLINDLNDYRIYLANVNEFLRKLSKNQPYSENLDIIIQIQLPKEIQEVIDMCKLYNTMLVEDASPYEQILLFDTDIFDKFLKIRKETAAYNEMKKLKVKIENKIDLFVLYAFSVDLQEEFLK